MTQKHRAAVWSAVAKAQPTTPLWIFRNFEMFWGAWVIQSGVDACALPPQSKSALDSMILGCDLKFLIQESPASEAEIGAH